MIAIVDYKAGNLTSVARALEYLGHRCEITDRPGRIRAADRVILPGVGAAGATMENLDALGLPAVLHGGASSTGPHLHWISNVLQPPPPRSEERAAVSLRPPPGPLPRFPSSVDG